MATYVIGDIHGCYRTLERLLKRVEFDRRSDDLWLVGDLVNRGPSSLEVLLWAVELSEELGPRFRCVLGNHELHLIRRAEGLAPPSKGDRLKPILRNRRRERLIEWLCRRPLLERKGKHLLVHAGLLPAWSVTRAERHANRLSKALRGPNRDRLLALDCGGRKDGRKTSGRVKEQQLAQALAVFVGIRMVDQKGQPVRYAGAPDEAPSSFTPWFEARHRRGRKTVVLFGHWAALGTLLKTKVIALDSGCVWGGRLSALRLEDRKLHSVPVHPSERP